MAIKDSKYLFLITAMTALITVISVMTLFSNVYLMYYDTGECYHPMKLTIIDLPLNKSSQWQGETYFAIETNRGTYFAHIEEYSVLKIGCTYKVSVWGEYILYLIGEQGCIPDMQNNNSTLDVIGR